jgi:hypothetical protein
MHWGPWANVAIVIGIVSGTIAIVVGLWSGSRWIIRRLRRRIATPAIDRPQRAVQPPTQVIQAPIVIPSAQAPRDGGAASTIPGPGSTTGTSTFETFAAGASRKRNLSETAFKPRTTVFSEDSAHAEECP